MFPSYTSVLYRSKIHTMEVTCANCSKSGFALTMSWFCTAKASISLVSRNLQVVACSDLDLSRRQYDVRASNLARITPWFCQISQLVNLLLGYPY